jgi:hypothetical protein
MSRSCGIVAPLAPQQLRFQSGDVAAEDGQPKGFFPVYVHHVSKVALQHLQESRSQWLLETGLDRGLHVNSNGTFVINFPARKGFDAGRIW